MEVNSWILLWQDDFSSGDLDRKKWHVDEGFTGESNGEKQIYTDRPKNLRLENNCLVIEAHAEEFRGYQYTSARITTARLHSWVYGRFETRMKIPYGQGIWPAFWMLGDDRFTIGWPGCGEIDIMENIGNHPENIRGSLHGPGYSRDDNYGVDYSCPGMKFSDDFHLFAVEWEPRQIRFFSDDNLFSTVTPEALSGNWVFDHPFHVLINLAIGGVWPGYPDESTIFPQQLIVDYVKVYQKKDK